MKRDPSLFVKVYLSLSDDETGTGLTRRQAWPAFTPPTDNLFQSRLIVAEERDRRVANYESRKEIAATEIIVRPTVVSVTFYSYDTEE